MSALYEDLVEQVIYLLIGGVQNTAALEPKFVQ
jgi:hypothetical protein